MLGTVDILDDENGTDTTATTNSTTTTTDADHVFMSFKIACMYVCMYVCMYIVLGRMKFHHCRSLQYSVMQQHGFTMYTIVCIQNLMIRFTQQTTGINKSM